MESPQPGVEPGTGGAASPHRPRLCTNRTRATRTLVASVIKLTDEQFRAIGRIAVAYAAVESIAPMILGLLTGVDPRLMHQDAARYQDSLTRVLEELRKACHARPNNELAQEVDRWVDSAFRVRDHRNRVMHTPWTSDDPWSESETVMKSWVGKDGEWKQERFTAAKLDVLAEEIDAVHSRRQELLAPLMSAPAHPLWRAKPSEWGEIARRLDSGEESDPSSS